MNYVRDGEGVQISENFADVIQGDSGGLRLGWVDLDLGSSPGWWPLLYCSYLLPKQGGGTSQI